MGKPHRDDHRPVGAWLLLAAWALVLYGTRDLPWGGLWWLALTVYCIGALAALAVEAE